MFSVYINLQYFILEFRESLVFFFKILISLSFFYVLIIINSNLIVYFIFYFLEGIFENMMCSKLFDINIYLIVIGGVIVLFFGIFVI